MNKCGFLRLSLRSLVLSRIPVNNAFRPIKNTTVVPTRVGERRRRTERTLRETPVPGRQTEDGESRPKLLARSAPLPTGVTLRNKGQTVNGQKAAPMEREQTVEQESTHADNEEGELEGSGSWLRDIEDISFEDDSETPREILNLGQPKKRMYRANTEPVANRLAEDVCALFQFLEGERNLAEIKRMFPHGTQQGMWQSPAITRSRVLDPIIEDEEDNDAEARILAENASLREELKNDVKELKEKMESVNNKIRRQEGARDDIAEHCDGHLKVSKRK
ncbi:hypothetical protein Bbelb_049270 [Branchiostoma belcheri]|nr:hypothetical protein Bbelb_049270 [Branchiostoma belcheri]